MCGRCNNGTTCIVCDVPKCVWCVGKNNAYCSTCKGHPSVLYVAYGTDRRLEKADKGLLPNRVMTNPNAGLFTKTSE